MTDKEFAGLVERLEQEAHSNPGGYKLRVVLLALLGYGYLGLVLSILGALLLAAVASLLYLKAWAIKLIIPLGTFIWLIGRALWVRFTPPEGVPVTRDDTPAFFAMIERLRFQLKSLALHEVLITDDFNAAVVQMPRLGVFGWHRNYLTVGLPLMKALTPEQLEAVLAHEFGHLAGGHAKLSNWIYRLRMSWIRLLGELEAQQSAGTFIFKKFSAWYAPYFNAYSFPLARLSEYEADAAAAALVSPRRAAEALTTFSVLGSYLDQRYWPGVHKRVETEVRPPFAPFSAMSSGITGNIAAADAELWLNQAMRRETSVADTHPSLADRLKALGEVPRLAPPEQHGAADTLLAPTLERLTRLFDDRWRDNVSSAWKERHREVQEGRQRLEGLSARAEQEGDLPLDDAVEHARLTEAFGAEGEVALPLFQRLVERAPDHPRLCLDLGQRLLWACDLQGESHIRHAMDLEPEAIAPGCEVLRDFHWRRGDKDQAYAWQEKLRSRLVVLDTEAKERAKILVRDKFDRHGLDPATLENLLAQLKVVPGVKKVYFVRKRLEHTPERLLYAAGFVVASPWWKWLSEKKVAEVQHAIVDSVQFPAETLVFCVQGSNYAFHRKFRWMRGSRIL